MPWIIPNHSWVTNPFQSCFLNLSVLADWRCLWTVAGTAMLMSVSLTELLIVVRNETNRIGEVYDLKQKLWCEAMKKFLGLYKMNPKNWAQINFTRINEKVITYLNNSNWFSLFKRWYSDNQHKQHRPHTRKVKPCTAVVFNIFDKGTSKERINYSNEKFTRL